MLGLICAQFDGNTAQQIHDIGKLAEIHFHIAVNIDTKIPFQGPVQQIHAAPCVAGIEPVAAVTGNFHIQIPEERSHDNGFLLLVHCQQDHGIGAFAGHAAPLILTDEQNIDDSPFLAQQIFRRIIPLPIVYGYSIGNIPAIGHFHPVHSVHKCMGQHSGAQHQGQNYRQKGIEQRQQFRLTSVAVLCLLHSLSISLQT